MTSKGAVLLFDTLRQSNSVVSKLSVSHNQLDDEFMKSLGEYIQNNKSIEEIWLQNNKISDSGIEMLVPYFEGNNTLKRISIDGNVEITNNSIPFLVKMIKSSHVEDIGFAFTSITQSNRILVALAHNIIKNGSPVFSLSNK